MASKEEIRDRSDIVEVISASVKLQKRGRNWVGLCPFHNEKTPSFNVDPITRSFKCFGCGVSGDVFAFVEKFENMTFVEAADFLARRVGLELDRLHGDGETLQKSERDLIFQVNIMARDWYVSNLQKSPSSLEYLQARAIDNDSIRQFQLGYAPDSWDALSSFLAVKKQNLQIAETAGLLRKDNYGGYRDMFRKRILFPIHDEQERIVGFGGRTLGDEQPKYLNTGETPVFNKSKLLYGLPFARRKISTEGCVLLMEGYMDVIAAHQAGFTNSVATLGTALTEEHARKLARLTSTVILVYDGDNAGIKATLRSSEILEKEGLQVKVVRLPSGEDPDSLLKRGDSVVFQRAIDDSIGRVEYQLERIIAGADQTKGDGQAKMLKQIVAILASVGTRAERDVYIEKVWRFHPMSSSGPGIAKEQLHRDAENAIAKKNGVKSNQSGSSIPSGNGATRFGSGKPGYRTPRNGQNTFRRKDDENYRPVTEDQLGVPMPASPYSSEQKAQRQLLRALFNIETREQTMEYLTQNDFLDPYLQKLHANMTSDERYFLADERELLSLIKDEGDPVYFQQIEEFMQEYHSMASNEPITNESIMGCIQTLRKYRIGQIQAELARLLQEKPVLTEEDRERAREFQLLIREIKGSVSQSE